MYMYFFPCKALILNLAKEIYMYMYSWFTVNVLKASCSGLPKSVERFCNSPGLCMHEASWGRITPYTPRTFLFLHVSTDWIPVVVIIFVLSISKITRGAFLLNFVPIVFCFVFHLFAYSSTNSRESFTSWVAGVLFRTTVLICDLWSRAWASLWLYMYMVHLLLIAFVFTWENILH